MRSNTSVLPYCSRTQSCAVLSYPVQKLSDYHLLFLSLMDFEVTAEQPFRMCLHLFFQRHSYLRQASLLRPSWSHFSYRLRRSRGPNCSGKSHPSAGFHSPCRRLAPWIGIQLSHLLKCSISSVVELASSEVTATRDCHPHSVVTPHSQLVVMTSPHFLAFNIDRNWDFRLSMFFTFWTNLKLFVLVC